jgi:hypothetical protein
MVVKTQIAKTTLLEAQATKALIALLPNEIVRLHICNHETDSKDNKSCDVS